MGIFDFIRGQFIDVIEWVDDTRDTLMYKFPDRDKEIKNGAQLTVREGQLALFMNEGEFGDMFKPGRYELTTKNIPILTSLRSWKYAFNSPFKADIYFFNTRQFTGLRWGTPTPVTVPDAKFGQVEFRAFGNYNFRISDPKAFFLQIGGTDTQVRLDEVEESLRSKLVDRFTEVVAEMAGQDFSFVQMQAFKSEFTAALLPRIQEYFTGFGLELSDFIIQSITLPDELTEYLRKNTQMNMMGDLNRFMQFQTAISLEKSAQNPSGGNAGVEMGAGLLMLGGMMQQQHHHHPSQQAQQPQQATQQLTKDEIMKLLKDLADLRTAGIITEAEFNAKKTELLSRL